MADGERIIQINIEDEMKSAYIDYSMSVIVSRALPDVEMVLNQFTEEYLSECKTLVFILINLIRNQQESLVRYLVSIIHMVTARI